MFLLPALLAYFDRPRKARFEPHATETHV
jgi:hypothetical protein